MVTMFKVINIILATFHFYYAALHLGEEVEYIWSKSWTAGKVLYLLTRYLGSIFLLCLIAGVRNYAWNDTGLELDDRSVNGFFTTCLNGELFAGLGPMIILLAEVILMMRVYALYEKSKFLLAFFIFLTAGLLGFNILQLSHLFLNIEIKTCLNGDCFQVVKRTRRAFIAEGTLLNFECMYALPISGIGWAVTSVVELLLFVLVIMKARKWEGSDSATQAVKNNPPRVRHIATRMARASIVYFAVIFTVCCIGAAVMFIEENAPFNVLIRWIIEYNRLPYETFVITVMTILAPKLILDLRKEFYGPPERKDTELTWNADVPTYSTMDGSLEGYSDREVLETFMD
ncbi:hypothetical protein ACEPAH_2578 [Sanghuangporus vaninii]